MQAEEMEWKFPSLQDVWLHKCVLWFLALNGKWITGILFGVIECKITEGSICIWMFLMWPVLQPKGLFEILHYPFSNKPWCKDISDEQEISWQIIIFQK